MSLLGPIHGEIETNFGEIPRKLETKDPTPCILDRAMVVLMLMDSLGVLLVARLVDMLVVYVMGMLVAGLAMVVARLALYQGATTELGLAQEITCVFRI